MGPSIIHACFVVFFTPPPLKLFEQYMVYWICAWYVDVKDKRTIEEGSGATEMSGKAGHHRSVWESRGHHSSVEEDKGTKVVSRKAKAPQKCLES